MPHPPGGLYCNESDFDNWDFAQSIFAKKLNDLIDKKKIKNIYLSDYFYSETSYARWLCDASVGLVGHIYLYYQSSGSTYSHISREFADTLANCGAPISFREVGCDVFDTPDRCGSGVNILHAKVKLFEFFDGSFVVFSGSGNANKSFFANLEDWQIWNSDFSTGNGLRAFCLFEVLEEISGLRIVPVGFFTKVYKQCLSSRNLKLAGDTPGVRIAALPSDADWYRNEIIRAIENADRIYVSSQYLDDPEIVAAITAKVETVSMIMDDDWYWALKGLTSSNIVGVDDVAPFKSAFQAGDLNISFLLTNHHSEASLRNTNHLRYLIARSESGESFVFTGGAHLKQGSIELNVEIQYILSDPSSVSTYLEHFSRLEAKSLTADQMPVFDAPAN
jgi:hypothetical protein